MYKENYVTFEPGEEEDFVRILFNLKRKGRYFGSLST